ncbi:hypothetical protein Holit_02755 [Hollandina sp. SP2]
MSQEDVAYASEKLLMQGIDVPVFIQNKELAKIVPSLLILMLIPYKN